MDADLESGRAKFNCHWVGQTTFNASRRQVYHLYRSRCLGNTHRVVVSVGWWQAKMVAELLHTKINVIYERYRFNNRLQESEESIYAYTTIWALRTLAETCEFGSLKEDLIRDRLVCGIRDNRRLLKKASPTLDKCLDSCRFCRAAEATKLQMQAMTNQNNESSDVKALKSSS